MAIAESYRRQVALLIRTVPLVAPEKEFALKGWTDVSLQNTSGQFVYLTQRRRELLPCAVPRTVEFHEGHGRVRTSASAIGA